MVFGFEGVIRLSSTFNVFPNSFKIAPSLFYLKSRERTKQYFHKVSETSIKTKRYIERAETKCPIKKLNETIRFFKFSQVALKFQHIEKTSVAFFINLTHSLIQEERKDGRKSHLLLKGSKDLLSKSNMGEYKWLDT